MTKKKKTGAPAQQQEECATSAQLFLAMQAKSAQWYEKEREGIALLESFQTALNACRDELSASTVANDAAAADVNGEPFSITASLSSLGGNVQMDPLLAEDLFAQVKDLQQDFGALLHDMYALHAQARTAVLTASQAKAHDSEASAPLALPALAPIDYYQFIGHELAAYEAEFQHIEALLAMISFDITTDELRTLVISWSTSPFLNPEQSRAFRKRHDLATAARSA